MFGLLSVMLFLLFVYFCVTTGDININKRGLKIPLIGVFLPHIVPVYKARYLDFYQPLFLYFLCISIIVISYIVDMSSDFERTR